MKDAIPFIAASVMYLLSPVLTRRAQASVRNWISSEKAQSNISVGTPPYYLSPEQIEDYIEFSVDAVQIVPAITLTGVGIVLALPESLSSWVVGIIYICVALVLVLADTGMHLTRPQRYLSRKFLGLSYVALGGLCVNLAGIAFTFS
ncbi:hypothetical protein [Streptomyces alanosinicus]|uniref:Uncharacterized protein n=1 Tax=Streptomyces alanosinicus TaxID=68171 RepID=A0A918YQM5_9ACTN|nr:hypothetical protein [Streptomyces alanosinicus]GHE11413.1 hypothetical protein GCM10010339_71180 [Streptomyces alanosinicus]